MHIYEDKSIHVILCIYDPVGNYSRHAATTITSIFMNTKSHVRIHLIHDSTLSSENRLLLEHTADYFKQSIEFVDIKNEVETIFYDVDSLTKSFSRGTLFRLFIHKLIPSVHRFIYLDCDIIVQNDISQLWKAFSGSFPVAAVQDTLQPSFAIYSLAKKVLRLDRHNYFCAGVCVMDFDLIDPQFDFIAEAKAFFKHFGKVAILSDQDFLNFIFKNNWQKLDCKFNRFDINSKGMTEENIFSDHSTIWHLGTKPWKYSSGLPTEALYWYYYAHSAYSNCLYKSLLETAYNTRYMPEPVGFDNWKRWLIGCIKWPFIKLKKHLYYYIIITYYYITHIFRER